ncbi:MAG: hypothetical protein ABFC94_00960 [Syntrophomonas sp.]
MKLKEKDAVKKSKKFTISTTLYIAASVVALIAVASLIDNIILYKNSVAQYVAQGYPVALVIKQLIPSQLLPGLFDTIAVYGGIALILFSAGIINKKVSECLTLLTKDEVCSVAEDNVLVEIIEP